MPIVPSAKNIMVLPGIKTKNLARSGGLDKTMTTSKTMPSGKTMINHGTTLQPVTVEKQVIM